MIFLDNIYSHELQPTFCSSPHRDGPNELSHNNSEFFHLATHSVTHTDAQTDRQTMDFYILDIAGIKGLIRDQEIRPI